MVNIEEMQEMLLENISHINFSKKTIISVLQFIIEAIELTDLSGPQKKTLALELLASLIEISSLDNEDKMWCAMLIDNGTIGDTIDLVISASRGKLKANNAMEKGKKMCITMGIAFLRKILSRKKKNKTVKSNRSNINTEL